MRWATGDGSGAEVARERALRCYGEKGNLAAAAMLRVAFAQYR